MASVSEKFISLCIKIGLGEFFLFVRSNGCILVIDREIYI